MLQTRDGSVRAFEELVRRHERRVLLALRLMTGNRHQAEDLSQEVFLRVFRARHTYTPSAKFVTWLSVIVNNVASNAKRSRSRRPEITLSENGNGNPLERFSDDHHEPLPTERLETDELRSAVRVAMRHLCERQRRAVTLQKFECMKYDQIAATMNTSPQAVKSLLARARVRLREYLEPYVVPQES